MAVNDEEMSWSLSSLSEGRISLLSNDGEVATQPRPHTLQESNMVILRTEENTERKGRKLKSKVWEEMTKYKGRNGKEWAKCSHCEKEFDGSSKKGTTHLKNHLDRCRRRRQRRRDVVEIIESSDSEREFRVDCGGKSKFEENDGFKRNVGVKKKDLRVNILTPSSWTAIWDDASVKGIFNVPPLSPHPTLGYPNLMVL